MHLAQHCVRLLAQIQQIGGHQRNLVDNEDYLAEDFHLSAVNDLSQVAQVVNLMTRVAVARLNQEPAGDN